MSKVTEDFNKLWEQKVIKKPLVILYGGYAGTGKSTTCERIMELIDYTTNLPTGVIRSSIADYLTNKDVELISSHTYQLHNIREYLDPNSKQSREEIINRFLKQISPIAKAINSVITFAASEKQHLIIDGNHVFPGLIKEHPEVHLLEFYNKVTDIDQHYKMLGGPTHSRDLSEDEFKTARILHDFTVDECARYNKTIYEYNISKDMVEKEIDTTLRQIINEYIEYY